MLDVFSWLFVLLDFSYLPFSDVFPAIIVCHLLYAYLFFFSKFFSFKVIKVLLQCPEYLSASLLISCFGYKHTFHFFHLTTLMSNKSILLSAHSSRLCNWSNFFLSTAVSTWQVFNYTYARSSSTFNVTDYLTDWNYIIVDNLYIYNNSTGGLLFFYLTYLNLLRLKVQAAPAMIDWCVAISSLLDFISANLSQWTTLLVPFVGFCI